MTELDQEGKNRLFDPIFPRLVKEESPEDKFLGFIAYGLYQEAKREWVSDFQARERRYPGDEELSAYERSWTASRLEALENAAAQLVTAYTDSVVTQVEKQILRSALKGSFWRAVWRWVVSALCYTILLFALDDRFRETDHGTDHLLVDSSFVVDRTRSGIMAGWRQAVELAMTGEEIETLTALSRSRTEPASRVSRAAMLLGYREKPSFFAVGRRLGVHHQTVQRCVERAVANGALAALDDRPRPGKEPTITPEAKAWLVSLACDKAKEHGYPHELWTTRLLARHAREHGPAAGHDCLAHLVQGTVCKILGQEEIKPHKVRYYLERRDAEFEHKMAEVLCVYREVQVLKKAAAKAEKSKKSEKPVAIVSFDEKPGIQAIATTAPDLPPVPGVHPTFARDHEYKRHGTLSLLAGIDLLSGKVHALVRDRHRSREFIEFLKLLDAAYPASTAIKLILDNHSAHISRETRAWLDTRPAGRFDFTFTPKHGSWLNLIEGFFSKFARSVLRHIRVTSKHELKQRIMAGIDDVNRHPVLHTWSYKLAEAADMIRTMETLT